MSRARHAGAASAAALALALALAAAPAAAILEPQVCLPGGCSTDADCVGTLGSYAFYLGPGHEVCTADGLCAYKVQGKCDEVDLADLADLAASTVLKDAYRWEEYEAIEHAFFCHNCWAEGVAGCDLHAGCNQWRVTPGTSVLEEIVPGSTAVVRAELYAACAPAYKFVLHAELGGYWEVPSGGYVSAEQPKNPGVAGADYVYYNSSGLIVATGVPGTPLEGLRMEFVQSGSPFQIAAGGNAKDASFGAAMWATINGFTNPTGGPCEVSPSGVPIDYNIDLHPVCLVQFDCEEPPLVSPCPNECDDDADCAGRLAPIAAALGLGAGEEECSVDGECSLDACRTCDDIRADGGLAFPYPVSLQTAYKWLEFSPTDGSRHAFTCHNCFNAGSTCPIDSAVGGSQCRDWVAVPGTTLFQESLLGGTARLSGDLVNLCDSRYTMSIDALLSGRVFVPAAGGPPFPPPLSPKSMKAGAQDFTYYTSFEGQVTGTGLLAGLVFNLTRDGPSFQWGIGANDKDRDLGASMWEDATLVSQPADTTCRFGASDRTTVDINLDFVETCVVKPVCEPDIVTCPCDVVYEVDCGCSAAWATGEDDEKCVCLTFADAPASGDPDCEPRRVDDPCKTGALVK